MKTLNTFVVAVIMVFVSVAAKADPKTKKEKLTVKDAIEGYLDAFTKGKIKGFADLLDENVKFTTTRGDKVLTYTKSDILETLRNGANIVQNCETSTAIVETLPNQAVVKVSMKYDNFTKENFITLTESDSGWKITHVSTSYK